MLKKLTIKNFQSHKNSSLQFSSGVNVIIGKTDSGKSAIIKALRLLIFNKPTGNSFNSHWGGNTYVTLKGEDFEIERIRGKTENSYMIKPDIELKAFGTSVPEEVNSLLQLDSTNIQQQLDTHFLLNETAGEVGQHFNRIANLHQIDLGVSNLKKWVRKIETDTKYKQSELEKKKNDLEKYDYLDKYEIELEVLEGIENDKKRKVKKKQGLTLLIKQIQKVTNEIQKVNNLIALENETIDLLRLIEKKQSKQQEAKDLKNLVDGIEKIEIKINKKQRVINAERGVNDLIEIINELNTKEKQKNELNDLLEKINKTQNKRIILAKEIKTLEAEFTKLMPKTCPLCGSKL